MYGGFETAAAEIGRRLVERGYEVVVYCRHGYGDDTQTTYQGIQKKYLPRLPFQAIETLSHTFVSLLHAFLKPPDVMIVMNPANGPLCVIPRLRGTPFAINVDGLDWKRGKWPWIGQRYIYGAAWFCTKIAPALIADSHKIQEFYAQQWNREAHYASYGTYLIESVNPGLIEKDGLRKREYFLVVARLEPENNTELIVRAFKNVRTDMDLVIVGGTHYEGAYTQNLKELVDQDPRVHLMGGVYEQRKLREFLCNAYAYVHGHEVGGTNPILLKALGSGCCVAYLDVDFNVEVVGDAGSPFPNDADQASRVLQELVSSPEKAKDMRKRARERVREAYCWDKATDDYETLIQQLSIQKKT
jgi:glycosyltransferase involved in cell wall biosynthesis